ncbi:FxSxx-COOH cyclophane-containing RiPP peptide [Streptomyces sp. VRA16 Mangrove soil]|uniref:FxSxx-COOH cyclophane-containing RiPP peptide n=1 Tax=Streptomyces sp. VRA16 Mangrove soil TaxID=2817434 RepID=UPI001A9FCF0A|nr:FxSxx-COOH cyclophane-containing RiPP peptide [Streptomyces sp. VRA16 Mangrove soil]MBO1330022.1 FXSXX-COOH protein [Streptomyces sp. VRA16 Mangrove soil]
MAAAEDAAPQGADVEPGSGPAPDAESAVLDVSGLSLEEIAALPPSALGTLLRRLHEVTATGDPFVTGHTESA